MVGWDERQKEGCLIATCILLQFLVKVNIFLQIMMSDVDFFVNDLCEDTKHKLEVREKGGMYPPRFHVVLSCSPSAREKQTRIEFRGAVTDLVFDILLTPSLPSIRSLPTSSSK